MSTDSERRTRQKPKRNHRPDTSSTVEFEGARLTRIADLIQGRYGHSALKPNVFNDEAGIVAGPGSEPLHGLVETILSQQSPIASTQRMSLALRHAYPNWKDMLEAGEDGLRVVLEGARGNLTATKAKYIHGVLQRLYTERGEISLQFLRDWTANDARAYLLSFNGVGPKTASCVLLFNLELPAMPVDTHVGRIAQRLGLVPALATPLEVQGWFEAHLPVRWQAHYEFHLNAIELGQDACKARLPRCEACVLNDECPKLLI